MTPFFKRGNDTTVKSENKDNINNSPRPNSILNENYFGTRGSSFITQSTINRIKKYEPKVTTERKY